MGAIPPLAISVANGGAVASIGEVPDRIDRDGLLGGYALCALSGGLSLFFGIGAIFTWYGWDIATDRKTGQLVIKRYGEPV